MPKGNSKAYLNSPMVDNSPIDYEENKTIIELCLDIFHHDDPDLSNPKEVENSINFYFQNCINKGLRPGNMGLYAAIGMTKNEVKDLLSGRQKSFNGKQASPAIIPLIKKACKAMSLYRESLGSQGKLSPPVLIFWQKNFDGLEDVQRIDIDANTAPKEDKSPEQIKRELVDNLPIESDYKEL